MKWKLTVKAETAVGTERIVERYALFPVALSDNYRVWLEKYYVKQKYFVFGRKGEWTDRETWSESTEKLRFLKSIKDSNKHVQY